MKTYPIRLGIFETNSSSSHSFTLGPRGRLADTIQFDKNGVIEVDTSSWECGEREKFNSPLSKLSYLLCFAYTLFWNEEDPGCEQVKYYEIENIITEVVRNFTGANEVKVSLNHWTEIDHQSTDIIDPRDLRDPEFIKEFVFNPSTWVYAIWDSYYPEEGFYEETEEIPIRYILKFDLPGIDESVLVPVKYGEVDLKYLIYQSLKKYYWSGERFYNSKEEDWYIPYSGNLRFGSKKVDFSIVL